MRLQLEDHLKERILKGATEHGLTANSYVKHLLDQEVGVKVDHMPLDAKAELAGLVASHALAAFDRPVVMFSGGKESVLVLHFVREAAERAGRGVEALFIDHFTHFDETREFVEEVAGDWGVKLRVRGTEELKGYGEGDAVKVRELSKELRKELERAGLEGHEFVFSLHDLSANHLLKTFPMHEAIRGGVDAVFKGKRWDENPAAAREVFFSEVEFPGHFEVHPVLPFTEKELWEYTIGKGLPIHPLYEEGFTSLGGKFDSDRGRGPAWERFNVYKRSG